MTIYCELVAKEHDLYGYTTYVFYNLDDVPIDEKYIMATRLPNWEHRNLDIGEKGYVSVHEVIAGETKWWNGNELIPYNYTNVYFIKFVRFIDNSANKDIII